MNETVSIAMARRCHAEGRYDEAITHWNAALQTSPNHLPARIGLGKSLLAAGQLDRSEELLLNLKRDGHGAWQVLQLLAKINMKKRMPRKASEYAREALVAQPSLVGMRVMLARALIQTGGLEEAERIADELIAADAALIGAFSVKADAAWLKNDPQQTLHWSRQVLTLQPTHMRARFRAARALVELNRFNQAEKEFSVLSKKFPHRPDGWYGLALTAFWSGELALAEQYYRIALEVAPTHRLSALALARLLQMLQRFEEAVAIYKTLAACELSTSVLAERVEARLAEIFEARGEFDNALAMWRAAGNIQPARDRLWRGQARCLMALGRYEEAVEPIIRAANLDSNRAATYVLCRQLRKLMIRDWRSKPTRLDSICTDYSRVISVQQRSESPGALLKAAREQLRQNRSLYLASNGPNLSVSLICSIHRPEDLSGALEQLRRQAYENSEIIIVLHGIPVPSGGLAACWRSKKRLITLQCPQEYNLSQCLNLAVSKSNGDVILKIDADDIYMPNYTADMVMSLELYNADVAAKCACAYYLEESDCLIINRPENTYIEAPFMAHGTGSTICARRRVFSQIKFPDELSIAEDVVFVRRCVRAKMRVFFADPFNHIVIRRRNKSSHTWRSFDDEVVADGALLIGNCGDFSVIDV